MNILSELLVFREQFAQIMSKTFTLIFFKEQTAHGHSFVKSDVIKLLRVAL